MATKLQRYVLYTLFILVSSLSNISALTATSGNIQRIRIDFTMPDGYVRHLLFAFTQDNSANDSYNYGWDAINKDNYPYDLNWMIGDLRCTIQGVGAYDDSKKYPLGLFMSNDGDIEIALDELENFDEPIDLFIYDSWLNTYTQINESNYTATIPKGDYLDRFYLAFKEEDSSAFAKTLSVDDVHLNETKISYLSSTKELYINTNNAITVKNIRVYNLSGQEVFSRNHVNSSSGLVKIPLEIRQTNFGIVTIETDKGGYSKQIVLN
ncbi:hypothetical protein KO566_09925 [Flavobacteriaceae bacterium XHP0103]|uniref:hypothetical protein n=1 Tax=Marixanthotalea marina TaxID=2844359 RepID=UPI0029899F94|nr:hypothetical protein [Marixanthotalea marina]MBU3822378.1 hypothetical protein [Marixanthotalea marina]